MIFRILIVKSRLSLKIQWKSDGKKILYVGHIRFRYCLIILVINYISSESVEIFCSPRCFRIFSSVLAISPMILLNEMNIPCLISVAYLRFPTISRDPVPSSESVFSNASSILHNSCSKVRKIAKVRRECIMRFVNFVHII